MKKNGFTLAEVIISCGILSLFMVGVISLYTSGGKAGNTTMWLQTATNQLKLAARQINTSIQKSSYPSKIVYPSDIIKSEQNNFKVRYKANTTVSGTETNFLIVTEAIPAKTGGLEGDVNAQLFYHVFSLGTNGDLIYYRYKDSAAPSLITTSFTRTVPNGTNIEYKTKLVKDVESIVCKKVDNDRNDSPLEVTITCHMPRSKTIRSEKAIGVPNVQIAEL